SASVLEGVHLLAHDVGVLADGAGEELGLLEDGGVDGVESVAGEDLPARGQDALPDAAVEGPFLALRGGKDVLHSFHDGDLHDAASSLALFPMRSPTRTTAPGT